ncbi:thioesterase family protein [Pusillimonas sp.]|uniref:acyl-CoA thioesterase n=1 Tax=Pusillimonas sp. TaxID=3040095 RepID=UPI0029B13F36|nr:thioesterase family protein [Pusillimonas sp.]MDX3894616.1 thioesterase family protein [Pusillimonas sp.]
MRTYQYERRLHWSECDPAGIIFFPNYTRWMTDGLSEFLLSLGIDPNAPRDDGARGGLPIVQLSMQFFEAPPLHVMVRHEIRVEKVGKKSLTLAHRFWQDQSLLAEANETRVWAAHSVGRESSIQARPIPDSVRTLLTEDTPQAPTETLK